MSQQLISHSSDLKKLRDEGYEVEIFKSYLVVRNIPYVNSRKEIRHGSLISELTLAGNKTTRPNTHTVYFSGELPCDKNGSPLQRIVNTTQNQVLAEGLVCQHMFSSKPKGGYPDFYAKLTAYINILSGQAQAIDSSQTAKTFCVIGAVDDGSVFNYLDTSSSRSEVMGSTEVFKSYKIAIVGVGGTGSYIMDFIAKTPVAEIHLFDSDTFLQHNAFRSPGAASVAQLERQVSKVEYLSDIYGNMHGAIVAHDINVDISNIDLLKEMDFVFLCIDRGSAKKVIVEKMLDFDISFIDVGMGVYCQDGALGGQVRVTTSTPAKRDHIGSRVSMSDSSGVNNEYGTNIQIAELNALNATLAVIKWKKLIGFYHDHGNEQCSIFTIGGNKIINEDFL